MHIDFYKKILMSTYCYWIVAQQCEAMVYCKLKRIEDDIIFIAIPENIKRGLEYKDIKLKDIEEIETTNIITNIYLTNNYAPFQHGISFKNIYDGFYIDGKSNNIKDILIKALKIKSNEIYKYKELLKKKE